MSKPSVGRLVMYRQPGNQPLVNGAREHPAVITRVWSDTCVNLQVLFDARPIDVRTSVVYDDRPDVERGYASDCWRWPERV